MTMLTIQIESDSMANKIKWLLQHFKKDGVQIFDDETEIISKDEKDYTLLSQVDNEERTTFEDYLKNENRII